MCVRESDQDGRGHYYAMVTDVVGGQPSNRSSIGGGSYYAGGMMFSIAITTVFMCL